MPRHPTVTTKSGRASKPSKRRGSPGAAAARAPDQHMSPTAANLIKKLNRKRKAAAVRSDRLANTHDDDAHDSVHRELQLGHATAAPPPPPGTSAADILFTIPTIRKVPAHKPAEAIDGDILRDLFSDSDEFDDSERDDVDAESDKERPPPKRNAPGSPVAADTVSAQQAKLILPSASHQALSFGPAAATAPPKPPIQIATAKGPTQRKLRFQTQHTTPAVSAPAPAPSASDEAAATSSAVLNAVSGIASQLLELQKQLEGVRAENTSLKSTLDGLSKPTASKSRATVTTAPETAPRKTPLTIPAVSKSQVTSAGARVPAAAPDTIASNSHTTHPNPDDVTTTKPATEAAATDAAPHRTVIVEDLPASDNPATGTDDVLASLMFTQISAILASLPSTPTAVLGANVEALRKRFPLRRGYSQRFVKVNQILKSITEACAMACTIANYDTAVTEQRATTTRQHWANQLYHATQLLSYGVEFAEKLAKDAAAAAATPELLRFSGPVAYTAPSLDTPLQSPRYRDRDPRRTHDAKPAKFQRPRESLGPMATEAHNLWLAIDAELRAPETKHKYEGGRDGKTPGLNCYICGYMNQRKAFTDDHGFKNCPLRAEAIKRCNSLAKVTGAPGYNVYHNSSVIEPASLLWTAAGFGCPSLLDDPQETTRNDTDGHHISHTLNVQVHGNPPIQLFGVDDPPKPPVSPIIDIWPAGDPPEVTFRDDSDFRAASISAYLPFWNDTIFPYLKLPRAEEDEIRDILSGIDVTATFTPYTGVVAGKLVVAAKEPPPIHMKNHKLSAEDADFLAADIAQLLACGAVRECSREDIHLLQPMGVVTQATKKRTIYDCRYLNRFCKTEDINFDSLLSFADQLELDDLMFKSDLKSGYHHLALLPISFKYFGFEFRGKFYVWLCLPLGWNCSPRKFQLVTRALSAFTARHGLAKMIYLDDFAWGIRKRTPARLRKWLVWQVFTDIDQAGFHASKKKSLWDPTSRMELLGMIIDSHELWFLVPEAKRLRYLSLLRGLLEGDHERLHVQVALLEQVLGKLQSLSIAIPTISLFLTKAYKALATARQHNRQFTHLPADAADDLGELFCLGDWKGLSRWPQWFEKRLKIFTDACDHSYGFSFLCDGRYQDFHGHFGVLHRQLRIHSKEHIAVQVAFEALPQSISDTLIDLYTDNEIVRWTVLKGGKAEDAGRTRAFALHLMHLQLNRSLRIRVFRVPTEKNVRSDWLSRLRLLGVGRTDSSEAMLHPRLFEEVQRRWYVRFTIDACANEYNRQTERFIAIYDSDIMKPVAANLFAYHFYNEYVWVFPPFALIGPALTHLRSCKAKGVMVIPHDTTKQWWLPACEATTASFTLARRGETALLDAATQYKTAHAPLKHDLIAIRFDFK